MPSLSTGEGGKIPYSRPVSSRGVCPSPHPKYPSPRRDPAAVAQPTAAEGKDNLGRSGVCCHQTTPVSRLGVYNALCGERRGGGSHPAPCPAQEPGSRGLSWLWGHMHVHTRVCMDVCACTCVLAPAAPTPRASSAPFRRLQRTEVSSPAAGPPRTPSRSPQPLHPRHSPGAGRDR